MDLLFSTNMSTSAEIIQCILVKSDDTQNIENICFLKSKTV